MECGQVHPAKMKAPKNVKLKVIVSKMEVSNTFKTELDSETLLQVDDELVVDDEESGMVCPILITSLEAGGKRVITSYSIHYTKLYDAVGLAPGRDSKHLPENVSSHAS